MHSNMYCQTFTMRPKCARSKNQAGSRLALPQLFKPRSSMMLHWLAASRFQHRAIAGPLATRQTRGNPGCKHLAEYVTAQKAPLYLNVQFTFSAWFSVFSVGSFHPTVTSQAMLRHCDVSCQNMERQGLRLRMLRRFSRRGRAGIEAHLLS